MMGTLHVCVAMKPLQGNFAANALTHGVAGLNIDRAKIMSGPSAGGKISGGTALGQGSGWNNHNNRTVQIDRTMSQGRWPANFVHDGSEGVMLQFPDSGSTRVRIEKGSGRADESQYRIKPTPGTVKDFGDTGSAARFFKQIDEFKEEEEK